jgi:hypothetical protein
MSVQKETVENPTNKIIEKLYDECRSIGMEIKIQPNDIIVANLQEFLIIKRIREQKNSQAMEKSKEKLRSAIKSLSTEPLEKNEN